MQKTPVNQLDIVALLEDKPSEHLVSGQVGTVIEILEPGKVFEVEFLDVQGRTLAVVELNRSDLLVLKHEAVMAA